MAAEQCCGDLFMVIAPSGAGKSSLVNALLARDSALALSISFTTRAPRPGELAGEHYYFLEPDVFEARQQAGEFIESAEVHGHFYGTSRLWIEQQLQEGHDIVLEIDWQGARQIKQKFPNATGVFILPPSLFSLEERLKKRGQDDDHVITRRLLAAGSEMAHVHEADFVVINQDFDQALKELHSIIQATRLRVKSQSARHADLFSQLGIQLS